MTDPVSATAAGGTSGLYTQPPTTRVPKQEMDGELFMKLLVTQLAHQDPSSPMDTNEMIGQTTQLAMMERLNALATQQEEAFSLQMRSSAAELIGRTVEYLDKDGKPVTGVAGTVSFAGPVPLIDVDGKAIALDRITAVRK
ncbi:flagellar hook capping FlgD N-terminal domain-containing protein [Agromyces sp. G08B096]|uniref:Flagellar hook capping FlgD N-terminal domain-containing protein n=1 Tax=Agromyces sp. G08B096 TaxID=3156399 RepID=A0AAU7W981_9MICO